VKWCQAFESTCHFVERQKVFPMIGEGIQFAQMKSNLIIFMSNASWGNGWLTKWQVDEIARWCYVKLKKRTMTTWSVQKIASWQNVMMAKWQVDKMAILQNGKMARWQMNNNGKLMQWLSQQKGKFMEGYLTKCQVDKVPC